MKGFKNHLCMEIIALIICVGAFIGVLIVDRAHVNALVALLSVVIPILWRATDKKLDSIKRDSSQRETEDGR